MGKAYDGRQTDAWACGVVLYTLATRRLPFDAPSHFPAGVETDREDHRRKRAERKALLNRIAVGTYSWLEPDVTAADAIAARVEVSEGTTEGDSATALDEYVQQASDVHRAKGDRDLSVVPTGLAVQTARLALHSPAKAGTARGDSDVGVATPSRCT